jgi:hypothetical protein
MLDFISIIYNKKLWHGIGFVIYEALPKATKHSTFGIPP